MKVYQIQEPTVQKDNEFTTQPKTFEMVFGIDLGTTNSLIGYKNGEKVDLIKDYETEKNFTPSIVAYSDASIVVGEQAIAKEGVIFHSIKRKMHNASERLFNGKKEITPIEISAEILKKLAASAHKATGNIVKKAIITVPAYFDESARQATKDAARLAGIEVLRLISEPTAAAIAYGLDNNPNGIYAVYDLGGGTFDISILRMQSGVLQVIASGGDSHLGGDDIDHAIARNLIQNEAAQITQKDLLQARYIKENITSDASWCGEFANKTCTLSYAELKTIIEPLLQKTIIAFKRALLDAEIEVEELNEIILVGGSTRLPIIKERIEKEFNKKPLDNLNPDEVVAIGAAVQAHGLANGGGDLLLDVIPLSLGIEVANGLIDRIIPRNTPIPVSRKQKFATQKDNQTGFVIHVLQGESDKVALCRSLAKFELKGIEPQKAGVAKVEIDFQIDADGLLSVSALDLSSGKKQEILVKPSYGLTEAEIIELIKMSL